MKNLAIFVYQNWVNVARRAGILGAFFAFAPVAWGSGNGIDRIDPSNLSHIDQYFVEVNLGSPDAFYAETGIDGRSTLDGRRDISLDLNGGVSAVSSKGTADSFLTLDNDSTTSSILTLDYGAETDLNRSFIFTRRQFGAVAINVTSVMGGSGEFSLTLRSNNVVGTSVNLIDFDHAGTYYFHYSDPGFANLRLQNIDEVILTLTTTTPGTDFEIGGIYRAAIPEPSSWILFGTGAICLVVGALRRRRLIA